ncbi:hypothetical protein CK203_116540 [Vitis vinifera]|uniref:Uncharacterized protein n=1 Tax=Vitis vinifera TaxID=29760 RepID=A0A438EAM8_VITVI|nr:hypothetical protein CK203_116540 [Vitis vinifera]
MDNLFKRANKYSMLEDDVHAATVPAGPGHHSGDSGLLGTTQVEALSPQNQESPLLGEKANKSWAFEAVHPLGWKKGNDPISDHSSPHNFNGS